MIYNRYPLIYSLNLFLMKNVSCESLRVCMCLPLISFGNMLRVAQAHILDLDQPLPFWATDGNPVDSGELGWGWGGGVL